MNTVPGARLFDGIQVLAREPNPVKATFPSEVLTCRGPDGEILRLLLKRGAGVDNDAHGHRAGVRYEAAVYDRILGQIGMSTTPLYAHGDSDGGWLVIGLVGDAARLHNHVRFQEGVVESARWIGQFHARAEALRRAELDLLQIYDVAYYRGWARRTMEYVDDGELRYPWLGELCAWFEEVCAPALAGVAATVVHGEFYPRNILVNDEGVHPIDWESAALGAGEVDLAAITDGWAEDVVERATDAYVDARWSGNAPQDFGWNCGAARMYLALRWLGDRPYWTNLDSAPYEFEALRSIGERMRAGCA